MFTPKGAVAEWRIIYNAIRELNPGDTVTYDQLNDLLGRDFRSCCGPLYRAVTEFQKCDSRTLVNVRGTGYRVAAAAEHEALARVHSRRSRRQLSKAAATARSARRAELTREQARRLDSLEVRYTRHADMLVRLTRRDRERQEEIQDLRRRTSGEVAELSAQMDRVTEVLRRHGIDISDTAGDISAGTQNLADG